MAQWKGAKDANGEWVGPVHEIRSPERRAEFERAMTGTNYGPPAKIPSRPKSKIQLQNERLDREAIERQRRRRK